MYYSAKDIYEPVIIFPYLNDTSQTLEVWVTSDLWDPISGIAQFSWVDWAGNPLPLPYDDSSSDTTASASSFKTTFKAGPINATRVLTYRDISTLFITQQNTRNTTSTSNSMISIENALLRLQVTASPSGIYNSGQQPWPAPSQQSQYSHTYWFHPTSLANSTLHDPGLKLTHAWNKDGSGGSSKNGNSEFIQSVTFSVTAQKAVAAWVWLDYSSSQVQGLFDYNGFWLNKGESKDVTFMVYNDWSGDGSWVDSVTVRSLYDNLGE
jgi:beta-mannosidase